MKIKSITSRSRRDFWAIYECEGCNHITKEKSGYDDRNFHDNVIPNMICEVCGESTTSLGGVINATSTKYNAWEVV